MDLEVGQVLWLNVRYQADIISPCPHPMLVAIKNIDEEKIEVIAMDKVDGHKYQLLNEANRLIKCKNEEVIYKDSYAQLNNTLTIEYFPELTQYRKITAKLSSEKLEKLINDYEEYHNQNFIPDKRIVHMTKEEILKLNDNN